MKIAGNQPRRIGISGLALVLSILAASARADLVISLVSIAVLKGGAATVNFFLTSDASPSAQI
jgi:hypothetical protein